MSERSIPTAMSGLRDAAEDAAEDVKKTFAPTVREVADTTNRVAAAARRTASDVSNEAADRLGQVSDYVRDIDPQDVWAGVQKFVKARPMESLVGALIVGFLIGSVASHRG